MSVEKQAPPARAAWVSAGGASALPGELHISIKHWTSRLPPKVFHPHAAAQIGGQTSVLFQNLTLFLDTLHAFPSVTTWLLQCIFHTTTYRRSWVFCGRRDNNLHRHQEPLLLSHCPCRPAASPGSVPVLAELPATYTAWNPGWKDGVLMFVAPWGIPGQAQLNS